MKIPILGIGVDAVTRRAALALVRTMLDDEKQHQIVTVNPEFVMEAQRHREFRDVLRRADLAVADGVGILLASRSLGSPLPERITGIELLWDICQLAAETGQRVFLLGGKPGVAHRAAQALRHALPALQIVGAEQGERHWWRLSDHDLRGKINRRHPRILFVAFGAPKQDLWIARNLPQLHSVRIAMGVGGAFDFLAGEVRRAPNVFRAVGLEWLWRLAMQPWRFQRIMKATWHFWRAVQQEKRIGKKKKKNLHEEVS